MNDIIQEWIKTSVMGIANKEQRGHREYEKAGEKHY